MNCRKFSLLASLTCAALFVSPVWAQATRTWVSGVGDDVNPCSRTAPCKTFAGAISKTAINGEINCLDPGGYGAVTITKSMTIDCKYTHGSTLASGTNGININIAPGNANDPHRTVRLRGLSINGTGSSGAVGTRTGFIGININSNGAAAVFIEDSVISDFITAGIRTTASTGADIHISNTTVRNVTGPALVLNSVAASTATVENSRLLQSGYGVATGPGCSAVIRRSTIAGNGVGVEADAGAIVSVTGSLIANNDNGVQALGTIILSDNDITRNGTAFISNAAASFGTNRLFGNGAIGLGTTAVGSASNANGQF